VPTSSFAAGVDVPIPTLPEEVIVKNEVAALVLTYSVLVVVLVAVVDVVEAAPIGAMPDCWLEVEVFWLVPPADVVGAGVVPVLAVVADESSGF